MTARLQTSSSLRAGCHHVRQRGACGVRSLHHRPHLSKGSDRPGGRSECWGLAAVDIPVTHTHANPANLFLRRIDDGRHSRTQRWKESEGNARRIGRQTSQPATIVRNRDQILQMAAHAARHGQERICLVQDRRNATGDPGGVAGVSGASLNAARNDARVIGTASTEKRTGRPGTKNVGSGWIVARRSCAASCGTARRRQGRCVSGDHATNVIRELSRIQATILSAKQSKAVLSDPVRRVAS